VTATDAELGRGLVAVIVAALDELDAEARRYEVALDDVRARGYRIVTHDIQSHKDGSNDWQVIDVETREVLAMGCDLGAGLGDDIDAAWRDEWFHDDRVYDLADAARSERGPVESFGLPDDIARVVGYWAYEHPTEAMRALAILDHPDWWPIRHGGSWP
jgi:hypothetical protein